MLKPIILDENTLILDTETTALGSDAEICEISIIDGLGNIVFDSLIKPINSIPEGVIKIHGITNEMVENAPSFEDVYSQILLILFPAPSAANPFKTDKTVIIYNKMYDMKILKQVSVMCNKAFISPEPFEAINTYTICAMRHYSEFKNQSKWSKLTDACISMGIDITQFKAHRALGDCQMTLELIKCMNDPEYIKTVKKKETVMLIEKSQTVLSEIVFDINFTPSVINFDENAFKTSINKVIEPVKNLGENITKEVLKDTLAKLRKFQTEISNRRIAIINDIKAPITDFEAKIKKGDAEIEQYISKYDANLKAILAKEIAAKHTEIEKRLPGIIENNKLDKDHAAKLTILPEYNLAKWTIDKIALDLVSRAIALFKQQDYIRVQEELKNTQIESRTRLIEQLNKEYDMKLTYSMLPINLSNDAAVYNYYNKAQMERQHKINENAKIEQAKAEEIKVRYTAASTEKQESVVAPEQTTEKIIENIQPGISLPTSEPTDIWRLNQEQAERKQKYDIFNTCQNLRLCATSQADILSAVAKLKASGLSVEFIE